MSSEINVDFCNSKLCSETQISLSAAFPHSLKMSFLTNWPEASVSKTEEIFLQ